MASVYDLLRVACGLSQQEAADFHEVRLDSIKSWCSDRRRAPVLVVAQLQVLMRNIERAGEEFAAKLKPDYAKNACIIGMPQTEKDAKACGFPSLAAQMRAIAIAISRLPDGVAIELVERTRLQVFDTPTMKPGVPKMRSVTMPIHHDIPDPAPNGFQTIVNSRPRTRAEIDRATFRAENGARFKGVIQDTPAGPQASYTIEAEAGNSTNVMSDIRLLGTMADAEFWLDQAAAYRGFSKYPLERRSS
jgi:hypothetical protein